MLQQVQRERAILEQERTAVDQAMTALNQERRKLEQERKTFQAEKNLASKNPLPPAIELPKTRVLIFVAFLSK